MKSIKDIRETYDLITEREEQDMNKLSQLVRAGLFDAKKLSALKRAMEKPADKMTAQEKRMLINLLDSLMAEVLSDKMVYRKIKQDVMKEETTEYFAVPDPRVKRYGYPSAKEAPSVLLLKRKAIRVFPDGQKVALYYAQSIDKYVSIPFSEIGISEEHNIIEVTGSSGRASNTSSSSENSSEKEKYLEPLTRERSKLRITSPTDKERDDEAPNAYKTRLRILDRKSAETQSRMNEDVTDYMDRMGALYGGTQFDPGRLGGGGGGAGGSSRTGIRRLGRTTYYKNIDPKEFASQQARKGFGKTTGSVARPVRRPATSPNRETNVPGKTPQRDPRDIPYRPAPKPTTPAPKPAGPKPTTPAPKPAGPKPTLPETKPGTQTTQSAPKSKSSVSRLLRRNLKKAAAGAGAAAAVMSLRGGSGSGGKSSEKYLDPMKGSLKMTTVGPKREGDPSSNETRINIIQRKAAEAQSRMNESVSLDLEGNLFEINSKAAAKITSLYESLNKKNKKKMIEMMKESNKSLEKIISFAVRQ